MANPSDKDEYPNNKKERSSPLSAQVGHKLRTLRKTRKLSIRALAEKSGLSVNTLSLIENGKTSPSVSTLARLSKSLDVEITAFFEIDPHHKKISYQREGKRQQLVFSQGQMEKLNEGLPRFGSEPFITMLEPGASSGTKPVVFPGREFIYCLDGHITYIIEGETYPLAPGDSLIFDAYTPHQWRNTASNSSRALLVLCPEDSLDDSPERYFMS